MTKKKQVTKKTLPVEENVQEIENEVVEKPVIEEPVVEEPVTEVNEQEETKESVEEETIEEDVVDPEKILDEFSQKTKEIDSFVTNNTTQEELTEKLKNEMERIEDVEEKLQKHIADLEGQISPKAKSGFTQFWMGMSDGWFN